MTTNSLAFRLVVGAMLWCGFALLVGGYALATIFNDTVTRRFDDRLITIWESLVASAELDDDGRIVSVGLIGDLRFQQTFSGWYWEIMPEKGESSIEVSDAGLRSRSLWDQSLSIPLKVNSVDYSRTTMVGPEQQVLRQVTRKIRLPNTDRPYIVVVAADQREVVLEAARFNAILVWSFVALGVGLVVAMLIQVRVGLAPLREVRRALAAIRAGKAERLDGQFPSEIKPLANELNALIRHNSEVLKRSRTQVGNLAHALKTPLSVLTNEVEAHPGRLANTVGRQIKSMRNHVEHYLSRARAAATSEVIGARTDVGKTLQGLTRTLSRIYTDRDLRIELDVSEGLFFRGEQQDLEEVVGNLLDNACKWAKGSVRVTALVDEAPGDYFSEPQMLIEVEDDGEGLTQEERAEVIRRGARLDETVAGSGLGLSIVADIVQLYGGRFALARSDLGGLKACIWLPIATA